MRHHLLHLMPALLVAGLFVSPALAVADEEKPAAAKPAAKKGKTILKLEVEPPSEIYVDGKKQGKKSTVELEVRAGAHIVRFVHDSGDEHENQIIVKPGETTAYQWKFDYSPPPGAEGEKKDDKPTATVNP